MSVPRHQSQLSSVLPEQLIYLHNQAYVSGAAVPTRNQEQPEPSSLVAQLKQYNEQQQQQQVLRQPHDTTRLNESCQTSAKGQLADNQLILSPSSLFLPFLQSEAARRLQLQRSRSSERDNRSTCDNLTSSSYKAESCRVAIANHCDRSGQLETSSNSRAGISNKRKKARRRRSFWERISGRSRRPDAKRDRSHLNSVETVPLEANSSQETEDRSNLVRDGRARPDLAHETSSSFENDYLHHRHFQARASICSTNVWRIGPTRRCSMAVPSCYPSYYRPQVSATPIGRPDGQSNHQSKSQLLQSQRRQQRHHQQQSLERPTSVNSFSSASTLQPAGVPGALTSGGPQAATLNQRSQVDNTSSSRPANSDILLKPANLIPQQIMLPAGQTPAEHGRLPVELRQTHLWPPMGISGQLGSDRLGGVCGESPVLGQRQLGPRTPPAPNCSPRWPPPPPSATSGQQGMLDVSGARCAESVRNWHVPGPLPRSSSSGNHKLSSLHDQRYLAHQLLQNGCPAEQLGRCTARFESECSLFNGHQQLVPVSLDFNRSSDAQLASQQGSQSIGRALGQAYLERLRRHPTWAYPAALGPCGSSSSTNTLAGQASSLQAPFQLQQQQPRPSRSSQRTCILQQSDQRQQRSFNLMGLEDDFTGLSRARSAHRSAGSQSDPIRRSRSSTSMASMAQHSRQGQQLFRTTGNSLLVDCCKQCISDLGAPLVLGRAEATCNRCDHHLSPSCGPACRHLTADDSKPTGGLGPSWPANNLSACNSRLGHHDGSHITNVQARHRCNYGASVRSQKVLANCDGSTLTPSCCRKTGEPPDRAAGSLAQSRPAQTPLTSLGLMKLISEVDKAIQNAMFIAQHIDNLDEFESVSS